jgi:hypothetical protein
MVDQILSKGIYLPWVSQGEKVNLSKISETKKLLSRFQGYSAPLFFESQDFPS